MYKTLPHYVLGFHGCDKDTAENILAGKDRLKSSKNDYDWLGHGIYFWENNPTRALEYAAQLQKHPERCSSKIKEPAVRGAIIFLGNCLNLAETHSLKILKEGYNLLQQGCKMIGTSLPVNSKPIEKEKDILLRRLDCAAIEIAHLAYEKKAERTFDTVRGVFVEGKKLYPNAGFRDKNHIQVCVRNPNCIKGYFRLLTPISSHSIP
jgi:hypothetical protein